MTTTWTHRYLSTACEHAINEGRPELHTACRNSCKYATEGHPEYCVCACHGEARTQPGRTAWVDQARDVARELYRYGYVTPEMEERVATDPALFWLRGEEAPPGEWQPPTSPPADT